MTNDNKPHNNDSNADRPYVSILLNPELYKDAVDEVKQQNSELRELIKHT